MTKDINGTSILSGDYVLYAALWDRSATLKYGRVTIIKKREAKWRGDSVVAVQVVSVDRDFDRNWELQAKGRPVSLGFPDRMVVVPEKSVPKEAREILDAAWDNQ